MTINKTSIFFRLEKEALLQLRKTLFKEGLSPQEFFAFIIERLVLEDERLEDLVQELHDLKLNERVKGGIDRKHVNADSLYEAIEEANPLNKKDTDNDLDLFEED